ncbi:NAD(P)/FAD-dependent oxidoreductase [Microcystis aeruginosa]|uniref:FAD-dependent oxidoreductase n=1 Tax=Microcystis aeruginosa FD4 TaxID=2686288 RepID=A0A857CZ50_MICAE|nr:FAD-binding oxidoreductase [Microcystis aeruginosa]QGZ88664.1 FAD-dependent oxidoreductase [Microcystis aeruginosa FD4]
MTTTYDYIIIGGGITGSALSYELANLGSRVLLLEKETHPLNATFYSYGGLAYWSATTEIQRKLYQEGREIQRNLSQELGIDNEYRDLELILTVNPEDDLATVAEKFAIFAITPEILDPQAAIALEPLLNPAAISGVLRLPHGHINAEKTNLAYQQAFLRLGGTIIREAVIELIETASRITGVKTPKNNYYAGETIVCAGGLTRSLLQKSGITASVYFTHAQVIKIPPSEIKLNTLVMPAIAARLLLEQKITQLEKQGIWQRETPEIIASVLETGAVQFQDQSLYLGQISTIITDPGAILNPLAGEKAIRAAVGTLLPSLASLPGNCHHCLVAFAPSGRPLVGAIADKVGLQVFSGFTSTLVSAPPLARRFARHLLGENDEIITNLQKSREKLTDDCH